MLGGDELADDGPGQGQADIHPQHRDDPGQAERHDELAEHLQARGAERIEQLLAIRIDRLDARKGGERRHHQGQRSGDRDLGGDADAEHQHDERGERELG
jgi:hypothetical protein